MTERYLLAQTLLPLHSPAPHHLIQSLVGTRVCPATSAANTVLVCKPARTWNSSKVSWGMATGSPPLSSTYVLLGNSALCGVGNDQGGELQNMWALGEQTTL